MNTVVSKFVNLYVSNYNYVYIILLLHVSALTEIYYQEI
jgi:hypothetical protein